MFPKSFSGFRFVFLLLVVTSFTCPRVAAQGRQSGEIRGTVLDPSEAPVPGTKVTVTGVATGVSEVVTSNSTGGYDLPYVPPGEYNVTFEKQGFKTAVRKGIQLHLESITVDVTLEVGSVSEEVSVTADTLTVQTESAVKDAVLTGATVTDIPSMNRQWYDLLATMPGVNPGGGEVSSGQTVGVNGQQPNSSSWQIDGGIAMLGQSANPDNLAPPLESIEEVSLSTANFGAEHGNGLSVFNVITKSGTNNFHGSLYEYIQNEFFNARNFFTQGSKPVQRWNEYGGNLGGPIKRDKAFFFFNYERNPIRNFSPAPQSYPTEDFKNGNFSALLGGPAYEADGTTPLINPCDPTQVVLEGQLYDPATTRTVNGQQCRDPFPGNIILTSRFDAVAANIQKYFPAAQDQSTLFHNYYWNQANPSTNDWTNAKVDYNLSPANRISASFLFSTFNQQFTDVMCSISCGAWSGNEAQGQITDVWTFSPNLINEFRFSLSREAGNATVASQGKGFPAKLQMVNPVSDMFPDISISGALSTSIGYAAGFPPAIDHETTFIPSDVVTWIKGKHIIKFGGEFDRWWVNTGWGTQDNGTYTFDGAMTQNPADQSASVIPTEGEGYADFLLGTPSQYGIAINPETGGRMWSAQTFVQDAYKVKPNLTLTLGLRYVIQSGWSEVNNRISSFDPKILNPAPDLPSGTLGAMWYGGQKGRRALTTTIPDFFAPRVGVAWAPSSNLSIRGGFGIYSIIASQNYTGGASGPAWGQGWVPAYIGPSTDFPLAQGPPAGTIFFPSAATRTPDGMNGGNVNYSIYNSPLPHALEYQLDVQYQLKNGFLFDAAYVGNRGVNLPYTRDLNQLPDSELGQGQAFRPYPQYADIMAAQFDGWSNYNALQVSVKKQTRHGLTLDFNYSFAKVLDTITSSGWSGSGGAERTGIQDATIPGANYGRASNDIRNMINGNFVYELPFGAGKRFANKGGIANVFVGGWEVSSIFFLRSGLPFSPTIPNDGSGAATLLGDHVWRPNIVGDPFKPGNVAANPGCAGPTQVHTLENWFNTCAFVQPQPNNFGNLGRNTLSGPNWRTVDFAAIKNFPLHFLGDGGNLQFKLAITDLFNHPNFGFPGTSFGDSGYGIISYANTSRQMQLGLKFSF
jgi:hypothetical protein